ncbi:MAG: hypothetical protein NZ992_00165 [Candidatus Korarchaeum sp.]|nr:hypothetical protein [Candidatus Korarchaeum sp.]MDW8093335.1 hypothetical protein [Nitrososphaerota archaeon]
MDVVIERGIALPWRIPLSSLPALLEVIEDDLESFKMERRGSSIAFKCKVTEAELTEKELQQMVKEIEDAGFERKLSKTDGEGNWVYFGHPRLRSTLEFFFYEKSSFCEHCHEKRYFVSLYLLRIFRESEVGKSDWS